MTSLPPLAQGARLVLGHPEQQRHRAHPPHPVVGKVPGEVAGVGPYRRPRECPGDDGRQRERGDEQHPVRPASPPPGQPVRQDPHKAARPGLHKIYVSSRWRDAGRSDLTASHLTATTRPPAISSSSAGFSLKTAWVCPAAAQTSSSRRRSSSTNASGRSAWPTGGTPPMENPVFSRT